METKGSERLVRISDHLYHEIERMELYYDGLHKNQDLGELQCALVDSFTIHARCLSEFLWDSKNPRFRDSDVRATDFEEKAAWQPPVRSKFLEEWCEYMADKRLAHLTFERLDIKKEQEEWPIGQIYWEIKKTLEQFYRWVPKQNIGQRLKTKIDLVNNPDQEEKQRPINQPTTITNAVGTAAIHQAVISQSDGTKGSLTEG